LGKIALTYGAISGSIVIGVMIIGFLLSTDGSHGSMAFGYLIMIVALSLIFLAIKRYRDQALGGVIKFGSAFLLGLSIAAVAGVFYVAGWEGYLAATGHRFIEDYAAGIIEAKKAAGLAGEALQAEIAKMDELKANYANPLFRLPMTFIEIFPVGLIIALISAAVLRIPKVLPARHTSV
jgi:hypothetical protein